MSKCNPLLVGASLVALMLGTAAAAEPASGVTPSSPKVVLQGGGGSEAGQAGTGRETGTGQSTTGAPAVTTGKTGPEPSGPAETTGEGGMGRSGTTSGMGSMSGPPGAAGPMGSQAGATAFHGMRASELTGKDVVNAQGREIGTIDRIVKSNQDRNIYAVVSPRGASGEEYVVPLDQLQPRGDNISAGSMTQDELRAMSRYNPSNYEQVAGDQSLGGSSQTR